MKRLGHSSLTRTFAGILCLTAGAIVLGSWVRFWRPAEFVRVEPEPEKTPVLQRVTPLDIQRKHLFEQAKAVDARLGQTTTDFEEIDTEEQVSRLSPSELRQRLEELNLQTAESSELKELLIRRWASMESAAAAGWAARIPDEAVREKLQQQVALGWAERDPDAAWTYATGLPTGGEKFATMRDLAYEASRSDPVSAIEKAGQLPTGSDRDDLINHAVSQWAATDPYSALAWAEQEEDPQLRVRLMASIATGAAELEGVSSAVVASRLPPGAEQKRAIVSIAQKWSQTDRGAAMAWMKQFPDPRLKEAAVRILDERPLPQE